MVMECIYLAELNSNDKSILVQGGEAKHLKVLRIKPGEKIGITNGFGLFCEAVIVNIVNEKYLCQIKEYYENYGELKNRLGLAVGILQNRERFEFLLEKAIELGITDFFPLKTDFSQKVSINMERLMLKSISTIKQCKRSRLPKLNLPLSIKDFLKNLSEFSRIILLNEKGNSPDLLYEKKSAILIVGCEGGFSNNELELFEQNREIEHWNLGNRRLRAETAGIAGLSLLSI